LRRLPQLPWLLAPSAPSPPCPPTLPSPLLASLGVGGGEQRVLEGVILLPLLHVVVELAGLGEHALDASRRGRAAEELRRHLGQVRQASRAAARYVGRLVVVARLPPRQDVEVD